MPLTDTVQSILSAASQHGDHTILLPSRLPAAAQRAVAQSMLKAGLLEEIAAEDEQPAWRTGEDGQRFGLRATTAGLDAVGTPAAEPVVGVAWAKPGATRLPLRAAAQAFVGAWDSPDQAGLADAIVGLRVSLASARVITIGPRQPRPDTKRATVLGLLRRSDGTTVAQVVEATGWAKHTVHGFLASLKKAGTPVKLLDRVRQVGPGKQGAAGSYTIYHVAEVR